MMRATDVPGAIALFVTLKPSTSKGSLRLVDGNRRPGPGNGDAGGSPPADTFRPLAATTTISTTAPAGSPFMPSSPTAVRSPCLVLNLYISLRLILAATDIYDVSMVDGTDHSIEVNMLAESTETRSRAAAVQHAPHQAGGLPAGTAGRQAPWSADLPCRSRRRWRPSTWRARRRVLPRAAARCPEVHAPR